MKMLCYLINVKKVDKNIFAMRIVCIMTLLLVMTVATVLELVDVVTVSGEVVVVDVVTASGVVVVVVVGDGVIFSGQVG